MKKIFAIITALALIFVLCACGAEPAETKPESEVSKPLTDESSGTENENTEFYKSLEGKYADLYSGRATATVKNLGSHAKITVNWSSSAKENTVWEMNVRLIDGKLKYSDGGMKEVYTDESGKSREEIIYTDMPGYFEEKDGKLYWTGAADDCKLCEFEKF